jgi:hypothetical protein
LFLANDSWKTKSSEFDNFVLLLLFLLKLGKKLHKSDQSCSPESELPSKKPKLSNEQLTNRENTPFYKMLTKQISKKEASLILPNFESPSSLLSSPSASSPHANPVPNMQISSTSLPQQNSIYSLYEGNPAMNFELETVPEAFYEQRVRIFRALHLLHQEMKISVNNRNWLDNLSFLLYNFAVNLDHSLSFMYFK